MRFFNWFGQGSSKSQADELSRAIAGELITIEWHEEDKKHTAAWIAERREVANIPGKCFIKLSIAAD